MAYSAGSITFSLACICIVLCSTYPAAVFSKPTRSSQIEQSEKELKRTSKFDVTTLATEEKESPSEETKATEHPPDNYKRTKHVDFAKFAALENEGTTEKAAKKSSKSNQDAPATVENEQIEKSKVQRKKSGSKESSPEDFAESQKEQRTADDVGFDALFSKGSSDEAQVSNGDGEASNKRASEGAREDSQTPDKTGEKSSKRENKLADDAAKAEALPSAERQRGKMADTTPSPTSTSVPAVPTTGSSASINIPRATCSFALALIAVFAAL